MLDELKESLERLQTDHVDLIQVHAVNAMADLEQALAPDGAVAALEEARAEGLTRFIGITGHARPGDPGPGADRSAASTPSWSRSASATGWSASPETFVLPVAREHDVGVIAMKVLGHGEMTDREPGAALPLGLPGVSLAIVGHGRRSSRSTRTSRSRPTSAARARRAGAS